MTVAAVLLAAGGGSRFDAPEHKLRSELGGRAVLSRAVDNVLGAGFDEIIIVTGAVDVDDLLPPGITVVHNETWETGQASSLRAAITVAEAHGHDAVVVGLGDQPGIAPSDWMAVRASRSPIAVATYDGRRRNPVRLAAEVWPHLPVEGDEGARSLIATRTDWVEQVSCHGNPADIDTVEDLRAWS